MSAGGKGDELLPATALMCCLLAWHWEVLLLLVLLLLPMLVLVLLLVLMLMLVLVLVLMPAAATRAFRAEAELFPKPAFTSLYTGPQNLP